MPDQLPKFHSLTGCIDLDRLRRAFKAVKRNRGAAGVDKVSIRAFEANLDDNLAALMFDLKREGRYRATPLRRVYIPKGDGKLRPLGIPMVRSHCTSYNRVGDCGFSQPKENSCLTSVLHKPISLEGVFANGVERVCAGRQSFLVSS